MTTPDLTGRTVIVTGATSGVGRATADALVGAGARVVLAVRNQAKGDAVATELRAGRTGAAVEVRVLDLADLSSVRAFAAEVLEREGERLAARAAHASWIATITDLPFAEPCSATVERHTG